MPVNYTNPIPVISKSADRVRLTRLMLMLRTDNPEKDDARFYFEAMQVEMINDPKYVAPAIPQIPDPGFQGENPPMINDPDYVAPAIPQVEKLTTVDSKVLTKSIAEVAAKHPADFAAAYEAIKKVSYALMESENIFPAGTIT